MSTQREVRIPVDGGAAVGTWTVPPQPRGIVIFAHGSGSSRLSPRNTRVAQVLQHAGLATLLLDLLTPEEERVDDVTRELRFDIPFLAERLVWALDWARGPDNAEAAGLPIGFFGASTGAGAALRAAAVRPQDVAAVVSRGGRPDLAHDALPRVTAPTLLIVGEDDVEVLALNQEAARAMRCEVQIAVVPGATHLFEEPGTLDQVAVLARSWFEKHLG